MKHISGANKKKYISGGVIATAATAAAIYYIFVYSFYEWWFIVAAAVLAFAAVLSFYLIGIYVEADKDVLKVSQLFSKNTISAADISRIDLKWFGDEQPTQNRCCYINLKDGKYIIITKNMYDECLEEVIRFFAAENGVLLSEKTDDEI